MINAYVGKKSYGCNVLKEKLSILNVYYVTPKEAKSIYKSKNLTLTKILRKYTGHRTKRIYVGWLKMW